MRKAVVLGLGLLLCLVGVIVFAQLFGSGSLFPVTVNVYAVNNYGGMLSGVTVTVNPGNYTVVTPSAGVLSLRVGASYTVTASWQQAVLARTITVNNFPRPAIIVVVDVQTLTITSILFTSW